MKLYNSHSLNIIEDWLKEPLQKCFIHPPLPQRPTNRHVTTLISQKSRRKQETRIKLYNELLPKINVFDVIFTYSSA